MATGPGRASAASTEPMEVVVLEGFLQRNSSKNSRWGPSGRHHPAVVPPQTGARPLFPSTEADMPDAATRSQAREEVRHLLEAFLSRDQSMLGQTASSSLPFPARSEVVEGQRRSSVTLPRVDVKMRDKTAGVSGVGTNAAAWVPPRPMSYVQAVDGHDIPSPKHQHTDMSPTSASSLSSLEDVENNNGHGDPLKARKKKSLYQRAKERLRMSLRRDQARSSAASAAHDARSSQHGSHHTDPVLPHDGSRHGGSSHDKLRLPHLGKPWKHDAIDKKSSTERHGGGGGNGVAAGGATGGGAAAADVRPSKKHGGSGSARKPPSRSASISATLERLRHSLVRRTSSRAGSKLEDRVSSKPASESTSKSEHEKAVASKSQGTAEVHTSGATAMPSSSDATAISDKESLYKKVAERLAKIADAYVPSIGIEDMEFVESDGGGSAAAAPPFVSATELALEQKLAAALCAKVDRLSENVTVPTDAIRLMVQGVVYTEFSRAVNQALPQAQPEAQQLAMLFRLTEGAVRLAGTSAVHIKDYTLRYIEDNFAHWIFYGGGWDSMLEDSDFEVD